MRNFMDSVHVEREEKRWRWHKKCLETRLWPPESVRSWVKGGEARAGPICR